MSNLRSFAAVKTAPMSQRRQPNQTVSVIIPTYNHAHFLPDALSSVLTQTRPADEIIVVDDGSCDNPGAVIERFPGVRLIKQENRGRSAARNTGLWNANWSHVVFLDADDRLLPNALEVGLNCAATFPDCGFVYGGHRDIAEDGTVTEVHCVQHCSDRPHLGFLRRNLVRMQATVVFRRDVLIEAGGFDESLELSEDYDLFLRIAQAHSIGSHPAIVAEYRRHRENTSADPVKMLHATLEVLDQHEARICSGASERAALREGRAIWRAHYAWVMLECARGKWPSRRAINLLIEAIKASPRTVMGTLRTYVSRRAAKVMPSRLARWINRQRGRADRIPVGAVQFGDLRRIRPISRNFGFDRGLPIDRYYIDKFLSKNADDIRGRVLEAGDDTYTIRFGGTQVKISDIIHLDANNPRATIVGDLGIPNLLPENSFDCIVLTHALHYVFDIRGAVKSLHQALKPGGVLLATIPGVSGVDDGEWGGTLAWSLTAPLARRLFEECFDKNDTIVDAHGNVLAATAFLQGLAVNEVTSAELDAYDPRYPVVVAVRAVKATGR